MAALYQQGRAHHIGTFPQFEDQMTNFTSDIDRVAAGYSPDRVDALVWAFTQLLVEPMKGEGFRLSSTGAAQRRNEGARGIKGPKCRTRSGPLESVMERFYPLWHRMQDGSAIASGP